MKDLGQMMLNTLVKHFDFDASNFENDEGWCRFELEGHHFQFGDKGDYILLCIDLDEIDMDIEFDQVYEAMEAVNAERDADVLLGEEDNYFHLSLEMNEDSITDESYLLYKLQELLEATQKEDVKVCISKYRMTLWD